MISLKKVAQIRKPQFSLLLVRAYICLSHVR